ncbi:dockerin type I repeat-containing protein [Eubacterium sp.]|uniref:dockerin type I repeat-containing protein n=1 Tax=Eubacterium sp. TaxID=142586 RepID=UPI0026DEB79F|nr:dockerin type I repeat-containing protein [Eubacterium sp.]MDO5433610.1 dockerin type I repeat-containing protein [Eubacterium sp.]
MIKIRKKTILKLLVISIFGLVILAGIPFSVYAEELPEKDSEIQNTWNPEEGSYVISTVEDLKAFRESLNAGETYYSERQVDGQTVRKQTVITLANDIVIPKGADIGKINNGRRNSTTDNLVTGDTNFEGYFNGQGHTIAGFCDTKTGLVDYLGYNGVITNLRMEVNLNFTEESFKEWDRTTGRDYGVICNEGQGQVQLCSVRGDVSIKVLKFTFYGIRESVMFQGKPLDWISCEDCMVDLNYSVDVKNVGEYGLFAPTICNITDCFSTRSSWRGSLTNCFSTGTVDMNVTTEEGKSYFKRLLAIGQVKSKDFVKNCYYDITPGRLDQPDEDGRPAIQYEEILVPIENAEDLTKASTYKGFDFDNIWTTNGDTTMPELRKDIPDEMLLPVIDDGGIKGDVNGDDKVDAKDATRIAQYITGTRPFTEKEKELADVNGDGKVDAKDRTKIQQYIVGMDEAL